jgi:hypothetical protein
LKQNPEKADFLTALKERLAERASGAGMAEGDHTSQALKPWQVELAKAKAEFASSAPERKTAEAKEEARVAAALNAEAAEKAKQKAAEAEKASKAPVTLKLDANGIPLPPPPPPMNPVPQKLVNPTRGMNKVAAGEQGKKSPDRSVQDAVLDELARKLAKRAGNASVVDMNPTGQVLKPWQVELAKVKAEFANSAPARKANEAKEDARVAAALNAEAAEKEKQKAAEAEKANRVPVTLKLDANGIPLPPPPPPPPSVNHIPREKFSQTKL